jgi:AraC-like DNA-binding protein
MFMPRESDNLTVSGPSPVLAAENHLLKSGCEGVPIGRSGGVWGVRSRDFPGGRLLVCEPREAFAMRVRSDKDHALAVVPLDDASQLVHQGAALPVGGAGFSMPGTPLIVHARAATRFAILWIKPPPVSGHAADSSSMSMPPPPDGHFGRSLEALAEGDATELAAFAAALSGRIAQALAAPGPDSEVKTPRRLTNRMAFVVALWDYISTRLQDDLSLDQLEQETGKSSRTLEYAFTEIVGRTPIGFIKALRLQQSRRLLLEGRFPSVKKAAAACGLWHFGRYSIDYRLHFGELPSDTLKSAQPAVK